MSHHNGGPPSVLDFMESLVFRIRKLGGRSICVYEGKGRQGTEEEGHP